MMIQEVQGKVNIRGVNHYYEWIRQPSNNQFQKPVMVFIHGWGGSCFYWRNTAQSLVPDYDCLLYDLRGFGQSNDIQIRDIGYQLEDYAEDLLILLDTFNLDKIYLNCHSMGASIASIFVNLFPEKVIKLILNCTGIFTYNYWAFSIFYLASSTIIKYRFNWFTKIPLADKIFMARFLYKSIDKEMTIKFLEDFLSADYESALQTIYSSVNEENVTKLAQQFIKISIPTLLITGEKDQIIPASMGKKAVNLNPRYISYVEIPKTGHFPMLEDNSSYLIAIQNFLNQ